MASGKYRPALARSCLRRSEGKAKVKEEIVTNELLGTGGCVRARLRLLPYSVNQRSALSDRCTKELKGDTGATLDARALAREGKV